MSHQSRPLLLSPLILQSRLQQRQLRGEGDECPPAEEILPQLPQEPLHLELELRMSQPLRKQLQAQLAVPRGAQEGAAALILHRASKLQYQNHSPGRG